MNPIARLSVDPLSEPRGESPTPRATDDDPGGFGLALAMAAAAQPQAAVVPPAAPVVVPASVPTGDGRGSDDADATRTLAESSTGARSDGMPLPASPEGSQAKTLAWLPVAASDAQAGSPGAATADPARPEPVRAKTSPALPSGNADAPATPVAAEAATAAGDASPRTADLPLTIRVLELVRGMTEQAARVALDAATSAGPAQAGPVPVPAVAERGRDRSGAVNRDGDGTARAAGATLAEVTAAARAPQVDASVPVPPASGSPAPQSVRSSAGSADPAAGAARPLAVPPEAHTSARSGDQVTLHFSGEDGLEGKLRVAVRGQSVRATILSDDPGMAERFSRGLGDLQRALLERGFSEARLNVQHTARNEGPASGNVPRDHTDEDSRPQGRDRHPSARQERESASTDDRPNRRPSRPRAER
jgi:hypothetical protein